MSFKVTEGQVRVVKSMILVSLTLEHLAINISCIYIVNMVSVKLIYVKLQSFCTLCTFDGFNTHAVTTHYGLMT